MHNRPFYIIQFIVLVLAQVFVLNNIPLWGYIVPMVFLWFILILPPKLDRNLVTLLGFILGLSLDFLSHTYGIFAIATTLVAFLRPFILRWFLSPDELDTNIVSYKAHPTAFLAYTGVMLFIQIFVVFMLEAYNLAFILPVLVKTLLSTLVSGLLIWGLDQFINTQKR